MKCLKCGGYDLYVKDSRPGDGYIRRKRVCRSCGHSFGTCEMVVSDSFSYKKMAATFDSIADTGSILEKLWADFSAVSEAARFISAKCDEIGFVVNSGADMPPMPDLRSDRGGRDGS